MKNESQTEYSFLGDILMHVPNDFEGTFIVPDGVKEIADRAFIDCTNLTGVELPTTLEKIGKYAFKYCKNLETIEIPDSVTEIGQSAFWMCHSLCKVRLSENLRKIESKTFRETPIEEIEIPDSVKEIGDEAFEACYYLIKVRLPNNIEIANSAFNGCTRLHSADAIYLNLYGNPHYKLIKVFPHAFKYKIPCDVVEIGSSAFKDCEILDSIAIPDSVKKIHDDAFSRSKIRKIKIGKGVATLPYGCFSRCELLEEIDIANCITSIDSLCFYGCINLRSIQIPNSVTRMGEDCFKGCHNLFDVTLSSSIERIESGTFSECENLESIEIPESVLSLSKECFKGCQNLQNIRFGNCIETIADQAFAHCTKLSKISLPPSVQTIGEKAFCGCSSLQDVKYCGNMSVGIDAFRGTLVKDNFLQPEFKYYGIMLPSQWDSITPPGKTLLKVYRGISVKDADTAEQLIADIKEKGLYLEQITEKYKVSSYKEYRGHNKLSEDEIDNIYTNKASLNKALEGFDENQVYFGDYVCALNYAVRGSSGSIPIIIEAEMALDELNVDGVDSFAHIFNPYINNALVRKIFGEKIEMYYEKFRAEVYNYEAEPKNKFRNAIINMAESDNDIVYAFYNNDRVIAGKAGNVFKCAFQAKLPISPDRILSVKIASENFNKKYEINLSDFTNGYF